eukprot:4429592-Pyramimonas_sp.AAC.1
MATLARLRAMAIVNGKPEGENSESVGNERRSFSRAREAHPYRAFRAYPSAPLSSPLRRENPLGGPVGCASAAARERRRRGRRRWWTRGF